MARFPLALILLPALLVPLLAGCASPDDPPASAAAPQTDAAATQPVGAQPAPAAAATVAAPRPTHDEPFHMAGQTSTGACAGVSSLSAASCRFVLGAGYFHLLDGTGHQRL